MPFCVCVCQALHQRVLHLKWLTPNCLRYLYHFHRDLTDTVAPFIHSGGAQGPLVSLVPTKTLTLGCENIPASWCTWMTYPTCWGHSWWSHPFLACSAWAQANPRTRMPSFIQFTLMSDLGISVFKQSEIQMSTDILGLFYSVWPSDAFKLPWGNQTLQLSFMTSQVCVFRPWDLSKSGRDPGFPGVISLLGARESTSEFDSWIQPEWLIAMIERVSRTQSVRLRA